MARFTKQSAELAIPSFITCGGDFGPLFEVAKNIVNAGSAQDIEIWDFVPEDSSEMTKDAVKKLADRAVDGQILPISFLERYGSPKHTKDMSSALNLSAASVAREIPASFRPIAHTMLPVKNGKYENAGVEIAIRSCVEIGPQIGNLVVHLAGCFASYCSDEEIRGLLDAQAADKHFMQMASMITEIDYANYPILSGGTERAAKELGKK